MFGGSFAGLDEKMQVAAKHVVLGTAMKPPFPDGFKLTIFAMGCFWGVERKFWKIPNLYSTQVGYAGGHMPNPTYRDICSTRTGHTEVVRVVYDPAKTRYIDLLKVFWENHDPTQANRQGNDVGSQYRSAIYCEDEKELREAENSRDCYQRSLEEHGASRKITTEIKILSEFYYAEDYHQQYLHKNPDGYCNLRGVGAKFACGVKDEL